MAGTKLKELLDIAMDSQKPMSIRSQAWAKYQEGLEQATQEFVGFLEKVKTESNESANSRQ